MDCTFACVGLSVRSRKDFNADEDAVAFDSDSFCGERSFVES